MSRIHFFLFLATAFVAFSCAKKSDTVAPKSKTDRLTANEWKMTSAQTYYLGMSYDAYALMDVCEKDNFITFNKSGTLTNDEGPTKCSSSDPQTTTGTWQLTTNETKLVIASNTSGSTTTETYDLVELSDSKLVFKYGDQYINGTFTYTKR